MKNVSTQRAITRQAYQFMVFGFGGIALGVFLVVLSAFLGRVPLAAPNTSSASTVQFIAGLLPIVGGVAGLAGFAALMRGATFKRGNPLADRVGTILSHALPDEYTYIRSINTFRLGYIDAVLVGPPGVLVFRIVEQGGTLLHEGNRWLKPGPDGNWLPAGFSASRECIVDMRAVKNFLARKQIVTEAIFGVAVLIGDAKITEKTPVIPGVSLDGLLERLRSGYMAKPRLDPAIAALIATHLTGA
ncbi:MAG: hypothetical protein IPK52_17535 [Chloroflexi bacterium]|nr:hypothetical protein [Chloroflexota bacterium]